MSLKFTPLEQIQTDVLEIRTEFGKGKTRPAAFRKHQLRQLDKLLKDNLTQIQGAIYKDLRKSPHEVILTETQMCHNEIAEALDDLEEWMKPDVPAVPLANALDGCRILKEPLGSVLIIGAWNYPIQLVIAPLICAISAGCCAIVKPSELAANTAQLLAELVPRYLDTRCYKIVNGAVSETSYLLEQRWDHIFYTGSGNVGKIIMAAAARQLCSVTLELGGKSPVIIDSNCDFATVANRIVFGRFLNVGQTCIAPDYILALPGVQDILIQHLKKSIKAFFGENPQQSADYGRIINKNHFNRVSRLMEHGNIVIGGQRDESDLYIAPTVITDVSPDVPVMKEEIFGPVLPILTVKNLDEAIDFVNKRDKPLALYVFSKDNAFVQRVAAETSSGGFLANDTIMHISVSSLPFGGVGPSGVGSYHAKAGFDLFSHHKSSMFKDQNAEFVNNLRYAPLNADKIGWVKVLAGRTQRTYPRVPIKTLIYTLLFAVVVSRIYVTNPGFLDGVQAFFGL